MKPIIRYCISHATPLIPPYWYDEILAIGDYATDSPLHISRLHNFWHTKRPLAYGAAGSYALPNALESAPQEYQLIGICSFRKAVLRRPMGRSAPSYPSMRELSGNEAAVLDASEMSPAGEHEFLLAQPLMLSLGYFQQYAQAHELVDLLDYTSLAIRSGVLGKAESADFVSEQVLIPGGCELGIFPRQWLTETLSVLSALGESFLKTYSERINSYDSYQVRAVGFLSERLGSFLLLRELRRRYPRGIPPEIFGHMSCVTEDGQHYTHGTTVK